MAAPACILCFEKIVKHNDRLLFHSRTGSFNASQEFGQLGFDVTSHQSRHICRTCHRLLERRVNTKNKLERITNSLQERYRNGCKRRKSTVKRTVNELLESAAKRRGVPFLKQPSDEYSSSDEDEDNNTQRPNLTKSGTESTVTGFQTLKPEEPALHPNDGSQKWQKIVKKEVPTNLINQATLPVGRVVVMTIPQIGTVNSSNYIQIIPQSTNIPGYVTILPKQSSNSLGQQ